jgi:hypothetical protein
MYLKPPPDELPPTSREIKSPRLFVTEILEVPVVGPEPQEMPE